MFTRHELLDPAFVAFGAGFRPHDTGLCNVGSGGMCRTVASVATDALLCVLRSLPVGYQRG